MKAPVNKIIPFSNVDGPGNRCAIFFQSCPFACLYCHNPETIHLCTNCGACVATCPVQALSVQKGKVLWNPDLCVNCDTCIHTCPHLASPKVQWMEVEELVEQVKKHRMFIRGITVSGGECMNQAAFLKEFFKEIKKMELGILIDSNGYYDFHDHLDLLALSDGVMLDVKAVDPVFHLSLTGQGNEMVLKNLDELLDMGKMEEVRTVLLPNQEAQNKKTIAYVVEHVKNRCRYKLIAYRPFGVREEGLAGLGRQQVSKAEMKQYQEFAESLGNTTSTIV